MIPKIIHYCWFGKGNQGELIKRCIESWEKHCKDYTIILWDEKNFDVTSHPFTDKMYKEKKFAFVADYVRLVALKEQGGIYLDTDMLLLKPLDDLLDASLLLGKESREFISCGMIGATPNHPFIESIRKIYDSITVLRPNPVIFTEMYNKLKPTDTRVMEPNAFYPFTSHTISKYKGQDLGADVYGIHLWNYSWGHPLNKLFKKLKIHALGVKIVELLGIKKILKRLLGFI